MALCPLLLVTSASAEVTSSTPVTGATQTESASGETTPASTPTTTSPIASVKKDEARSTTYHLSYTHIYNSNVRREDQRQGVNASVFGLGVRYIYPKAHPTLEVSYEVGRHLYPQVAKDRDRVSHNIRVALSRQLSERWSFEAVGTISLKGSTEDDDINNQYALSPRLEYRLNRENRLKFIGTYRIRSVEADEEQDAINDSFAVEYEHRMNSDRKVTIGSRYETNNAKGPRNDYRRWTHYLEFDTPVGGSDDLVLGVRYRPRKFDTRRVDEINELRRDRNWIFGAAWKHKLRKDLDFTIDYQFENRSSNAPDRHFDQHILATSLFFGF